MGKKLKSSKPAADKKPHMVMAPASESILSMPEATHFRSKPEPLIGAEAHPEANDAPLNFRVSTAFRREFRMYAAAHDMRLNEVLRSAFEALKKAEA